jgi:hypothetical protein
VPPRAGEASGDLHTFDPSVNVLDVPVPFARHRSTSRPQHKLAHAHPDETEGDQMDILEIEQKETDERELEIELSW